LVTAGVVREEEAAEVSPFGEFHYEFGMPGDRIGCHPI